jgi:hypothetical protein
LSDTGHGQRFVSIQAVAEGDDPTVSHRKHGEISVVSRS